MMVVASDSAEVADAVGPSPTGASLRGLDGVNLLIAGALSGFGPYVAAFLAEQNWTQQSIGGVLTAGGFAGLLSTGRRTRSPGVPVGRCSTRDPAARQDASGSSVSIWDG
jgi:hypothetical protein